MLEFSFKTKDILIMYDYLPLNHLFIPSEIPSKKLMIVLHGRGDSSQGFTWMPQLLGLEEMNYLLLDAPYEYFGGRSWYDLPPNQQEGITHSSMILHDILETMFEEDFNVSESFLFGFSQGSLMTFEFGGRYEKLLAGYIAVSGYIYDTELLLKEKNTKHIGKNWLCTHGTSDEVLPFETSKLQVEALQKENFDITFKSYPKPHTLIQEEIAMIKEWIQERL